MSDATTMTRLSSRRSSVPSKSLHPHDNPIDVSGWSVDEINAQLCDLGDRMDFVEVGNATIEKIFLSENVKKKLYNNCDASTTGDRYYTDGLGSGEICSSTGIGLTCYIKVDAVSSSMPSSEPSDVPSSTPRLML